MAVSRHSGETKVVLLDRASVVLIPPQLGRDLTLQAGAMPEKINRRDVLMRIGFTGTRQGMTERQKSAVRDLLASYAGTILHHGDAIGADAEAHDIALALGCAIVIHPPAIATERAFKTAVEVRAAKPYLVRNKHIVRETALLIAAPAEPVEQLRSGTWSTVRFAHRLGRKVHLLTP